MLAKIKHQSFQKQIENTFYDALPTHVNTEELFDEALLTDGMETLIIFSDFVKKTLEIEFNQQPQISMWKFAGYYHNTVLSHSKQWGYINNTANYRSVVGIDNVKLEFKQIDANTVELWNITVPNDMRKKGIAKKVIDILQTIAEEMDIKLQLVACAQGVSDYNKFIDETIRLRKWYYDLGFDYTEDSGYMVF